MRFETRIRNGVMWFGTRSPDGQLYWGRIEPRDQALDLHCGDCRRAGNPHPPRLARFTRFSTGAVEVTGLYGKHPRYPRHRRPDGGATWQLRCPQGHDRPVRHERIVAAFERFTSLPSRAEPDQDIARLDV